MSGDAMMPQAVASDSWEEAIAHLLEGRTDLSVMPADCGGGCVYTAICPCGPGWPFCGGC